jgi:hypothetical protein
MIVNKTIYQGLNVLGDITCVDLSCSGTGWFGSTLRTGDKLTVAAGGASITGDSDITGQLTVNDGTSSFTLADGAFAVQLDGTTHQLLFTVVGMEIWAVGADFKTTPVDIGSTLEVVGKASVGSDTVHADYYFYVQEAGTLNGQIALFKSVFNPGPSFVDIESRTATDVQLRFLDGGAVKWLMGSDASPANFCISTVEGAFSSTTDRLRMDASNNMNIYGDTAAGLYLTARNSGPAALYLSAGDVDSDVYVFFRQNTTAKYVMGYDDSSDSFKIETGDAFTASPSIEIKSTGFVVIPNIGTNSNDYTTIQGSLNFNPGPGFGGSIDLVNGFGKIANNSITHADTSVHTILSGVYPGATFLMVTAQDFFGGAAEFQFLHIISVEADSSASNEVRARGHEIFENPSSPGTITIGFANSTVIACDITVTSSTSTSLRYSLLRIG